MLHRPYIRVAVREEVENRAEKNENGQFLDANTHQPIEGKYDLGHKTGHEFRTEVRKAESENLTQAQFNDRMNNADLYQIEDPSTNRSHQFEAKTDAVQATNTAAASNTAAAEEESSNTATASTTEAESGETSTSTSTANAGEAAADDNAAASTADSGSNDSNTNSDDDCASL